MNQRTHIQPVSLVQSQKKNPKKRALVIALCAFLFLAILLIYSVSLSTEGLSVNYKLKNIAPNWNYPFGTDWMGRNMLHRTLKGLKLSFGVGILAAFLSSIIALSFSLLASISKKTDTLIVGLIDLFLGVPHIVSIILISFSFGGGFKGVILGIAFTHWPTLTRVLRAEVMQLKSAEYISISNKLGKSKWWIMRHHLLPHLLPQLFVGFILLFPHAILHEAAVTFLGFGLPSEQPAIGVILSESMHYLSVGMWWLAVFPGLALLIMVGVFDSLGRNIRKFFNPFNAQKTH